MKKLLVMLLAVIMVFSAVAVFSGCQKQETKEPKTTENTANDTQELPELWKDADYTEDTELGEGEKTVKVTVKAGEKSIVFTIKTDEEMLGDALLTHKLVDGEDGDFGLFISHVNGIRAVYEKDGAYWGFFQGGEYMMTGVDTTPIADGDSYELVYTEA